jgi:YggT family protein
MYSLLWLFDTLITLYVWILIASAILSWLVAFNVVNPHNQVVRSVGEFLWRVTEPAYGPIRRILPNTGGLDLAPLVAFIILIILQRALQNNAGFFYGF